MNLKRNKTINVDTNNEQKDFSYLIDIASSIVFISFLLLLLNVNQYLNYLIFLIILIYVLIIKIDKSIIIYFFLLPWEGNFSIPFLGSFLTLVQISLIFKYLLTSNFRIKVSPFELLFIMIFVSIGIIQFVNVREIFGIGLALESIFIIFLIPKKQDKYRRKFILEKIFFYTVISTILSLLYGLIHIIPILDWTDDFGMLVYRWVDGVGLVRVYSGILTVNQTAVMINLAIAMLLFSFKSSLLKYVMLAILFAFLVWTLSFTLIVIAIILILIYFIKYLSFSRNFIVFLVFIVLTFVVISYSNIGSSLNTRFINIINQLLEGDFNKATSDRETLLKTYLAAINDFRFINIIFGSLQNSRSYLITSGYEVGYSHNSFLDLFFTYGTVGLSLILIKGISKINILTKDKNEFTLIIVKIVLIISGLSISMSGYSFWYDWLIL